MMGESEWCWCAIRGTNNWGKEGAEEAEISKLWRDEILDIDVTQPQ